MWKTTTSCAAVLFVALRCVRHAREERGATRRGHATGPRDGATRRATRRGHATGSLALIEGFENRFAKRRQGRDCRDGLGKETTRPMG